MFPLLHVFAFQYMNNLLSFILALRAPIATAISPWCCAWNLTFNTPYPPRLISLIPLYLTKVASETWLTFFHFLFYPMTDKLHYRQWPFLLNIPHGRRNVDHTYISQEQRHLSERYLSEDLWIDGNHWWPAAKRSEGERKINVDCWIIWAISVRNLKCSKIVGLERIWPRFPI